MSTSPDPQFAGETQPAPPLGPISDVIIARPVSFGWRPPSKRPSPLLLLEVDRKHALLDMLGVMVVLIGLLYLPGVMIHLAMAGDSSIPAADAPAPDIEPSDVGSPTAFIFEVWFRGLIAACFAIYLIHRGGVPAAGLGARGDRWLQQVGWSVIGLVAIYVVIMGLAVPIGFMMQDSAREEIEKKIEFMSQIPKTGFLTRALLIAGVAVSEELIFRGLFLTLMRRVMGSWWLATLFSSVVFAALHFQQGISGIVLVFAVSIVLSVVFILSRSLIAVILAHFYFDMVQLSISELLLPTLQEMHESGELAMLTDASRTLSAL